MQPSSHGGTYVFGLTSTAFMMSEASRRKTHAPGRMPLFDSMFEDTCLRAEDSLLAPCHVG